MDRNQSPFDGLDRREEPVTLKAETDLGAAVSGKTGKAVWALDELSRLLPAEQAEQIERRRKQLVTDLAQILHSVPGLYVQIDPPEDLNTP